MPIPKSSQTFDEVAASANVLNALVSALLAEAVLRDSNAKHRMLLGLRAIRDNAGMKPEFKEAYDRAIDLVECLGQPRA
jgi:hypothetical protein